MYRGNLTAKSCGANVTTYNWDAQNRLAGLSGPGFTASFGYDALGRRVIRTMNGTTTTYVYDGAQAIAETKGGINATLLTGLQIDEVIGRYASTGNRMLLTDALGSVIAEVKDDRSIATRREYTPYGQSVAIGEASANDSQYTAREDDGAGLYFYRTRFYDRILKRFTSDDPIGLGGGINKSAYINGNPVNLTDPTGLIGYQGQELLDRWFAPTTDTSKCATAECAAGVLPTTGVPMSPESACELKCDLIIGTPCKSIAIKTPGPWYGKVGVYGVCNVASYFACKAACKEEKKTPCDPSP